jgi:hypothetical protein
MNKKVIYSALAVGLIITAGMLIKVQVQSAPVGSWAAKWIAKHPSAQDPATLKVKVPLLIKLLSKNAI